MKRGLHDLARHNGWATDQLISYCKWLDDELLNATVPGTYGTIIKTLRHIVHSEASYIYRLTGAWPDHPWRNDFEVGLDILAERAALLAKILEDFLAGAWDSEASGEGRGDEGTVFAIRHGTFLTQLLHHGNEHRAHVCTILGALGHDPPDVSAWGYALATGRSVAK